MSVPIISAASLEPAAWFASAASIEPAAWFAQLQHDLSTDTAPGQSSQSAAAPQVQFKSDFATLADAVQSGDITAAQMALKAIQADRPSAAAGYGTQSNSQAGVTSDLRTLFQAVQSGNLSAAQTALSALQSGAEAPEGGEPGFTVATGTGGTAPVPRHHHHGGGGGKRSSATSSTTTTTSSNPTASSNAVVGV